jgi:formylmethanofuran dehydrogenase subunit B
MTNTWQDIKNANVVVVMGGNAAEAHPCGFKWVIEAKIENAAKLVVIDPRFTRTASVADFYAPIRPGTDIAFLNLFRDIFPAARCVLLICFLSTTNTPQLAAGIFYWRDPLFA